MTRDFTAFLQANEGRIYYQLQRLRIPVSLHEEFYAEGIVSLWHAHQNYDSKKGEIGTFINYQIRFRFIDMIRKSNRQEEIMEQAQREYIVGIDDGNRYRKTGVPIPKMHGIPLVNEVFWHEVRKNLSANQWKWVHYYVIANLTTREIMELENVSVDAVKSWGREVRRKLRREGVKERLERLM